jgi:cobalt/nickel transport system ATP-binding protein
MDPMSAEPALLFENVTVRYERDAAPALAGVTLSLAAGERAALVGLNGSGKTTLLMAAVGLVGYEGAIRVCGTRVARSTLAEVRERAGFLFHAPEDQLLFPEALEDAAFGLLRRGATRAQAYRKAGLLLDELGVGRLARKPLARLSHGEKQRVALAGVLALRPPLLLLDEPSAGLDPPGRRALAHILDRLEAAMLVATHDLEFAGLLCRRFIALDGGRIAYDGPDAAAVKRLWRMEE